MSVYKVQYGRKKEELLSIEELARRFPGRLCLALVESDTVGRIVVDQEDGKVIITRVAK